MIKKIDHVVITTTAIDECVAFYKLLGFDACDRGARWELFAGDFKINVHILGHELEPKAARVQPGSTDMCFELAVPLEDYCEHLSVSGVDVELGIVERHGVRGAMRSVHVRDPDGNLVEFCSYE